MTSVCFPCFHTPSREHGHGHQASFKKTCVSRLQCPSMASQRACVFFSFPSGRDFIQMVVAIHMIWLVGGWTSLLKNISQTGPFPQVEVNRTSKIDKTMNHIWDISATIVALNSNIKTILPTATIPKSKFQWEFQGVIMSVTSLP